MHPFILILTVFVAIISSPTCIADPSSAGFSLGLNCSSRGTNSKGILATTTSGGFAGDGDCSRTPGRFTRFDFDTYNAPMRTTTVYALHTPSVLITPPFRTADVQPIFAVASACPVASSLALNWLFVQWTETEQQSLTNTYVLGTASWSNGQLTIDGQYDINGAPYWLSSRLMPGSCNPSTGIYHITANVEEDIKGDVYLNAAGMGVFKTSAQRATFFFPQYTVSAATDFGGKTFRGMTFDSLAADDISDVRNIIAVASGPGTTIVVEPLSDPGAGVIDPGVTYYKDTLTLSSINSPSPGAITGTVTRTLASSGNGTGNIACIANKTGNDVLLFCSGQSPGDNSIPYHISLYVENLHNQAVAFGSHVNAVSYDSANSRTYVGGKFRAYGDREVPFLARLSGGDIDTGYLTATGAGADGEVTALFHDSGTDKLYAAGWFQNYQGQPVYGFGRVNADGSFDSAFTGGGGPDYTVFSMDPDLANSRVWIGGGFTLYNGVSREGVAAVLTSGALDTTFATVGTGFDDWVYSVAWDAANGKLYAGGQFLAYNGTGRKFLARLNADGSLDTAFTVGASFDGFVRSVELDGTSRLYVGGTFGDYQGAPQGAIVRLTATGAFDTTFASGSGFDGVVWIVRYDPVSGKIYVGGEFGKYDNVPARGLARLNLDGTLDTTFDTSNAFDDTVRSIEIDATGNLTVGGMFASYKGAVTPKVARIDPSGNLIAGVSLTQAGIGGRPVFSAIFDPTTRKSLVVGAFSSFGGAAAPNVVRLNDDGTRDTTFTPGSGPDYYLHDVIDAPGGKYYLGGLFLSYGGTARNFIARVNGNGSLDTTFGTTGGLNETVEKMIVVAGSKILIGGVFTLYDATPLGNIGRLETDGTLDTTFNNGGAGFNASVYALAYDAVAGKIYAGGDFTTYNGVTRNHIARLNAADGSLDTTFNPGVGFDGRVNSLAFDAASGSIYVIGEFTSYAGNASSGIARLLGNAAYDTTFAVGTGFTLPGLPIELHLDTRSNKVLVGGYFQFYQGVEANFIARLNADGSRDTTFACGQCFNEQVEHINMDPVTGDYYIGGYFSEYDRVAVDHFVRVSNNGAWQ